LHLFATQHTSFGFATSSRRVGALAHDRYSFACFEAIAPQCLEQIPTKTLVFWYVHVSIE